MYRRVISLLLLLILCPRLRAATPATTQSSRFLPAAQEVIQHIQSTYYDPRTGLYIHDLQKREPEAMWGNGVMFSALVAAAKHDARTYGPIMTRFFTAMDGYW